MAGASPDDRRRRQRAFPSRRTTRAEGSSSRKVDRAAVTASVNRAYFGGYPLDRRTDAADHWQLAPGAKGWQSLAPLPQPRGHLVALVLDGSIYAISGTQGHDPYSRDVTFAERYDAAADEWETIPPPPFPVSHNEHSTFAYDGRLVTVGGRALSEGRENQDDVVSFSPQTRTWSHLGRIPVPLLGAVAFPIDDTIVAGFGAINGNDLAKALCQWQPKTAHLWQPKTAHSWGGRLGRSGHSPGDARRACWAGRRERSDRSPAQHAPRSCGAGGHVATPSRCSSDAVLSQC